MTKELARIILEKLYHHAWGNSGSYELREEFIQIRRVFQDEFDVGVFKYMGDGKIEWIEVVTQATSNLYAARLTPEELVAHHLDKANDHLIRVLEILQDETLDEKKVAVVKVYATTGQDLTRLSIETWTE